jgi:hypothetical protein
MMPQSLRSVDEKSLKPEIFLLGNNSYRLNAAARGVAGLDNLLIVETPVVNKREKPALVS